MLHHKTRLSLPKAAPSPYFPTTLAKKQATPFAGAPKSLPKTHYKSKKDLLMPQITFTPHPATLPKVLQPAANKANDAPEKSQPQAIILANCPFCHNDKDNQTNLTPLGIGAVATAAVVFLAGLARMLRKKPKATPQNEPVQPQETLPPKA